MKVFNYTIKDEVGLHARPAGLLAKKAKEFSSEITVEKSGKSVSATKLMMLMGLGIRHGDTVTVKINGTDEDKAAEAMAAFFSENL
ncbi:MAG: HPr family phosphocarrier protein [Oscillospiraceae bacterium]|nr:HPr family phosphocarrier protein [Oscillospiraceae bacterium]